MSDAIARALQDEADIELATEDALDDAEDKLADLSSLPRGQMPDIDLQDLSDLVDTVLDPVYRATLRARFDQISLDYQARQAEVGAYLAEQARQEAEQNRNNANSAKASNTGYEAQTCSPLTVLFLAIPIAMLVLVKRLLAKAKRK